MIPATLEGELLRRKARKDYGTYVELANPGFYMTHFHRYLCDQIQEFLEAPCTNGFMDILLLSVPPQHGKSYTVTETLPSWFLGRDPTAGVIIAGYESTFAEAFSRRNRDKFVSITQEVFLTSTHNCRPNKSVQGVALWETEQGGRCRAAGLKAGITGHGAELFIIDDPIKSKEQADSETILAKIHDEMGPSVQSRIHPGGKLIVIQTRWVEGDVIGWVQENWGEWVWKTINLPAEYDEEAMNIGPDPLGRKLGESLMGRHLGDDESKLPQKIANTNEWLQSKKRLVRQSDGDRTWNALYQGRPSAANGNLFNPSWWRTYSRTKELRESLEYLQMSVDATFKNTETSDYVAITLWGLKGRNVYLWKLKNKRMGFLETVNCIKQLCKEFPDIDELVIEDKANGSAIIDVLKYEENIPPVVAVTPLGGKYSRAQATSPFVATGVVHLPSDFTPEEEEDVEWDTKEQLTAREKFIKQHSTFPYGKRDDMVDSETQGISRIIKLIVGELQMPTHRANVRYTHWHPDMWEDYEMIKSDDDRQKYLLIHGYPDEWEPNEEVG
nr:MAG TPA: Terminase large subunit [Caudoviricetes sp.]